MQAPGKYRGMLNNPEEMDNKLDIKTVAVSKISTHKKQADAIINRIPCKDIMIKILPNTMEILSGPVKRMDIFSPVSTDMRNGLMPAWQLNIKRLLDIIIALAALIVLLPVFIYVAIQVWLSSTGPVFYLQERIGYKGIPFKIYKFRSMYDNAESDGPLLSSKNDVRTTPWGRIMRKWRLDELPQLLNILKGEMSLVGPRPERQYYIERMLQITPSFNYLLKVKPGLTSWGMVQFGYAENVNEMIERMKYDLAYMKDISLALDFKIMFHTLKILFSGEGK